PGVSSVVASTVLASIGDIARFQSPDKLSSYFGLTPRVRQSGEHPARHGRISKQGNRDARKMLVEAAWSAKTAPGPLRAFFNRMQKKHGPGVAAVATARKLAVMIRHVLTTGKDYAYARSAFTAMKLRKVALKAGAPRAYGKAGPGRDYWIKELREREAGYVARVEQARADGGGLEGEAKKNCLELTAALLNTIRGQADPAVVEEAGEVVPAPEHVVHRLQDLGGARQGLPLAEQPVVQVVEKRLALFLAHGAPAVGTAAVDGALGLEQGVKTPDRFQRDRGDRFAFLSVPGGFLDVSQFEEARRAWARQNAGVIGIAFLFGSNNGSKPL
ncbi:hypothetical protein GGD64_008459, partial [Bradyrhizobium sp. CIR3A]|nr:hypothetical protein [Bradyrhizobium sp. CIR3A]